MGFTFGPRRAVFVDIGDELRTSGRPLSEEEIRTFEAFDLLYRSLCALLYNYVPLSGHPGGSISSGRFVEGILFDAMDYDLADPERKDADVISYAAGHKALGLYAMWALRDEVARVADRALLPKNLSFRLRLEDLLGFRRNPLTATPLFKKYGAKALDGHPTPMTPFVRLSTGASGVGVGSSLGLAWGAMDYFGKDAAPRLHMVEGEGGMTPGRVSEALAAAGTASLGNVIMHIDWNQSSIDSNRVCRDADRPGDYVQWDPAELAYLHDWNVIRVEDGKDFEQVIAAQRRAKTFTNGQPTAIVYRTVKGWQYGIEGRKSHGAGHPLCSDGFYGALEPAIRAFHLEMPRCGSQARCGKGADSAVVEECFWAALLAIREAVQKNAAVCGSLSRRLLAARQRLNRLNRSPRRGSPDIDAVYAMAGNGRPEVPPELVLKAGSTTTLRAELGRTLSYYNRKSRGALLTAAADLLGSTSVNLVGEGFAEGYYNASTNPESRILSIGGICEDAMAAVMSGLSASGRHIGVCSSYGAFIAALGHIASRLHGIGNEARRVIAHEPYKPFILVCAHAGIKTGEDGPTHADPQPLQLLQENFPAGQVITLTPWDPQEIWHLVSAALAKRPSVICPFVTRPKETVIDRGVLGLAPAERAADGVYRLYAYRGRARGHVVLQGSEVGYEFVQTALPLLRKTAVPIEAYYVSSAELFDSLPEKTKRALFPEAVAKKAMGITGFTLPTMYRWVTSPYGRAMTLHPFQHGHFLGSGTADLVIKEGGLDGRSQVKAILRYLKGLK